MREEELNNILVSIIIPVYNVEKYLQECLNSVCNQTYRNLEIIVIDDESPDNSGKIADEYAERDARVRVIHIKNRGAAGARNVGLDECTGKYILFVDSDDWLELNAVEIMLCEISKTNSDILLCQYWDEFVNRSKPHSFMDELGVISPQEFVSGMLKHWEYIITANKLFSRSVLNNIRFVEGRCIDDEFFTYKTVLKSNQTVLIDDYLYHYRQRKSSAMNSASKKKQRCKDQIAFITQRYNVLCEAYPAIKEALLQHKTEVLMAVMKNSVDYPEVYSEAKHYIIVSVIEVLLSKGIDTNIKKSMVVFLMKKRNNYVVNEEKLQIVQDEYYE